MLQVISNHGPMEQPEFVPIPNGYGTVRLPHLAGQPGSVMLLIVVLVVPAAAANMRCERYRYMESRSILELSVESNWKWL